MLKVVCDTNIYISAILFGGNPEKVLFLAGDKKIELIISPDILAELALVLKKKFGWNDWQISEVHAAIREIARVVTPGKTINIIKSDDCDNRILECALEAGADYIVSGDKHLLSLGDFAGKPILSPAAFTGKVVSGTL